MTTLTVGDLAFEVRQSSRRRTMQITVDRGGELILTAPEDCAPSQLEKFVRDKRFWIYTKLAEKEALHRPVVQKQFKTGEGFAYLGRTHRLLLVDGQEAPVKLSEGRFKMQRAVAPEGSKHLTAWYAAHALPWLTARVRRWAKRLGLTPARVTVMELGFRWASCSEGGRLQFHWKTILLPPHAIDYVIVHELAHLDERHHTPAFWRRVERAMPDFEARKAQLAQLGAGLGGY